MPPRTKTKAPAAAAAKGAGGSHKFTPRPPLSASERLPRLYRALTDQVNDGYFDNAKKTCKKILTLDPASSSTFQTLLFLHLHTDDYTSALALVNSPPAPSPPPLDFERSYCLYRLHREAEALVELQKIKDQGRKEKHLEAQIRYRLGEYELAKAIYTSLASDLAPSSSEAEDIRTNQAATAAHLAFVDREYTSALNAPAVENAAAGLKPYTPARGELETHVPTVPIGWARALGDKDGKAHPASVASGSKPPPAAAATTKAQKTRTKPRHKLPKGAVEGKAFTEDPDRWLPLKQRASYAPAAVKKRGGREQTGLGTQGAASGGGGGGGSGGGGGGGNKKKGKKK